MPDQIASMRRASTPVDHLIAEMAAMPVASVASLGLTATDLTPQLPNRIDRRRLPLRASDEITAQLWRRSEAEMLRAFPSVSLEELVAIRDMLWFPGGPDKPVTMGQYLRELANMFMAADGAGLVAVLPAGHLGRREQQATSAESRRTLRWLLLAIPGDLLSACVARSDDALELALTNSTLDRMLSMGGFAEVHLHLGAAVDFSTIWHALVANLGRPDFSSEAFLSPGAELDEGRELAHWVLRAGIMRFLLARYLRQVASEGHSSLSAYVEHQGLEELGRRVGPGGVTLVRAIAGELRMGQLQHTCDRSFAMLQQLYRELPRVYGWSPPGRADSLSEIELLDPVSRFLPIPRRARTRHGEARAGRMRTAEQRYVGRGLSYLEQWEEGDATRDVLFAELFWQTVRIRCLVYRHLVQRPMTPGLQWFIRFFARASPAKRELSLEAFLDSAANLAGSGRGLRSLEVRTSPEDTLTGNLNLACSTARWIRHQRESSLATRRQRALAAADRRRNHYRRGGLKAVLDGDWRNDPVGGLDEGDEALEVGFVLHFTKDRGGGTKEGLPSGHWSASNADPNPADPRQRQNAGGYRYSAFYQAKRREAVALARTLQRWPRTLNVICGIDVCTDELGVPSWVMKPVLDRVRSGAALAGRALERLGEGPAPPLRSTIHAGEDFVHLATGLRSVDEAIEHLGLGEGDRIGHAISLGIDPEDWAYRIGRVAVPREVRLWDLAWEWSWIASRGGGSVPRHAYLERKIAWLTEKCWGCVVTPYELELLNTDLHDTWKLWQIGFPYGDRQPSFADRPCSQLNDDERRLQLLHRYLTDPRWFQEGRKVEWIDPAEEALALKHLQSDLRDKVANLGLTVEINPTSNLLIGDLGSLTNHPMWRLDPPLPDKVDSRPVAVAVGSDDPLMFGSSLVEEYNILYDGLMEAGLSDAQARDWLERVRRRGLESRFTRPADEVTPIDELPNPLRDYPSQVL